MKEQQRFTIIITAWNCEQWIEKCLQSALTQQYSNFSIVIVDALSDDSTAAKILNKISPYASGSNAVPLNDNGAIMTAYRFYLYGHLEGEGINSITFLKRGVRSFQAENILMAVEHCQEKDTICVSLDGDDWLAHDHVLQKLNEVYTPDIWMTYGSYQHSSGHPIPAGTHHRYPDNIININGFRYYEKQLFTHLRTWRRQLFIKINPDDLKKDGKFAWNSGDCFIAYPMLEMAGHHQAFIDEVLYVYNTENPLSDGAMAPQEQIEMARYAKSLPKYQPLSSL